MAEDQGHEHDERERARRVESTPEQSTMGPDSGLAESETPSYPASVLGDPRISGRGNSSVAAAVLQRMQQTYGNRAAQRYVQRSAAPQGAQAGDNLGEQIQSKAGGGNALDANVQMQLEQGLGADMSGVRVHTGGDADTMARSVDAVAFTTGNDIFFREGAYNPGSSDGMRLLAHEATHTVQQSQGPVSGTPAPGGVSISDPSDSYEQAAERAADTVVSRQTVQRSAAPQAGVAVQREEDDEPNKKPEDEEQAVQTMRSSSFSGSIQREAAPPDEEELPAQTMRASSFGAYVQREAAPEGEDDQEHKKPEEEAEVQTARAAAYPALALQRCGAEVHEGCGCAQDVQRKPLQESPVQRYAGNGPTVIQRSFAGSFPVSQGIFEMGMETQEGAVAGTGPSGLKGTIQFVPSADSPYSNEIALQQIVKLTDGGGSNVNPVSLPTATGAEVRTKEDKDAGVEGGFFTDVLHNDAFNTGKDVPKGSALSMNYPFSKSGSQVLGFKRSEKEADIKAAEMFDFPGTSSTSASLDFSFETVAKGTDSGNVYGSVKWAFGLRGGKVVNEDGPHLDDVASPTFDAATEKHRDFYVHEPVSFYFGFDSDDMESGEEDKIDAFLDYMKKFPDVRLTLHSFADQRGNAEYNKQLSSRRGNRVAQALIAKGIAADRINPIDASGATTKFTGNATTGQDEDANRRGNRVVVCEFEHTASTGTAP